MRRMTTITNMGTLQEPVSDTGRDCQEKKESFIISYTVNQDNDK